MTVRFIECDDCLYDEYSGDLLGCCTNRLRLAWRGFLRQAFGERIADVRCYLYRPRWSYEKLRKGGDAMTKCFWCKGRLIWERDRDASEYYCDECEGVVTFLHCNGCGASVRYSPVDEDDL